MFEIEANDYIDLKYFQKYITKQVIQRSLTSCYVVSLFHNLSKRIFSISVMKGIGPSVDSSHFYVIHLESVVNGFGHR